MAQVEGFKMRRYDMKTPDYKTLLYMQGLGAPVDELIQARQYNAIKRNIEALSDYELMYYHCKLLKMPLGTYDRQGLIMAMFHNVLTEYEAIQEMQAEAIEEARRREDRTQAIYKSIIVYWGLLCMVAVLLCFFIWLFWR